MKRTTPVKRAAPDFENIFNGYELDDFVNLFNKYDELKATQCNKNEDELWADAFSFFHPEFGRKNK